jgi:hypothetical protein
MLQVHWLKAQGFECAKPCACNQARTASVCIHRNHTPERHIDRMVAHDHTSSSSPGIARIEALLVVVLSYENARRYMEQLK